MKKRKPFYDENRKFTANKFTFKLSMGAVAHRPTPCVTSAISCSFCGSVKILSGTSSKKKISFCDRQCRGGWVSQNLEKSNLVKLLSDNNVRFAKERNDKQERMYMISGQSNRQTKWICCSWCDRAFKSRNGSQFCSESCRNKRDRFIANRIEPVQVICVYCGDIRWEALQSKAKKPFCSKRCERKASKERRKHWERCNGPHEYIALGRLIERDGCRCVQCEWPTTRYNGSYRPTDASIDHIVPLAKGGTHTWDNVQVLCILCNSIKQDTHIGGTEYLRDDTIGDTLGHLHIYRQNHDIKTDT